MVAYEKASCVIQIISRVVRFILWCGYVVCVCGMLEDINEAGYGDLVDEILQKIFS